MNGRAQDILGDTRRSVLIKDHIRQIKRDSVEKRKLLHSMKKSKKVIHDPVERQVRLGQARLDKAMREMQRLYSRSPLKQGNLSVVQSSLNSSR